MSKVVSTRMENEEYYTFIKTVKKLNSSNTEILGHLITIFNNVYNRIHVVDTISFEDRYETIRNEVDRLIRRLERD